MICPLCGQALPDSMFKTYLDHHVICPKTENRLVAVARRYADLAESIARPRPMEDVIRQQIEDILVAEGFVR